MELRHLRVFLVLVEELHFGRAAARLHIAQSAVSQTLKNLEAEVGARLIARTRRKVALTPAGEQFAEHARRAITTLEAGAAASRRTAAGETGRLLLRFTLMSALTVLPRAVARFRREYPGVELRIEPGGTEEQLQALALGQCDIGFVILTMEAPSPYQDERAHAAILASNYGEAAAIDFFGHDLPPALSRHNQYFVWGPRGYSGDVVIDVNGDCGASDALFASSLRAATVTSPLAMPSEAEVPIMICRGIRTPLPTLWPRLKLYW